MASQTGAHMAFQLWLRITRGLAALTLGTGLAFAAEPPSILPGPDVQPFADVTWNAQAGVPMPMFELTSSLAILAARAAGLVPGTPA